jgi:hypothetical protein
VDAIAKRSGGQNIVGRPQARPARYEDASVDAHEVEVFVREIDPATGAFSGVPKSLGRFPAEGTVIYPHNPDTDRDVIVYAMPYSADGTAGFSEIAHATQAQVLFRREMAAPVIGQNAPATTDAVEIGITDFTRFARHRRLTVSTNADMSSPLLVLLLDSQAYAARELPRYLTLQRMAGGLTAESGEQLLTESGEQLTAEDESAALPRTVYVTVAHSSGVAWTPESEVLEITFAAGDGTGGSAGDFDPTPRDLKNLDEL